MNKIVQGSFAGAVAISIFAIGFECGGNFIQKSIQKRLVERIDLGANVLADVFVKTAQENLSKEEVVNLLNDELDFIQIIAGE